MKIVVGGSFPPGATELFLKEIPAEYSAEIVTDLEALKKRTDIETNPKGRKIWQIIYITEEERTRTTKS